MIRASINTAEVSEGLRGRAPRVLQALRRKMDALDIALQSHIQGDKLSGQVLHHRSGKLFDSVRIVEAQVQGNEVTGAVEGAGGIAWYGRLHEYGGTFARKAGTVRLRTNARGELLRQEGGVLAVFAKASHKRVREVAYGKGTITFPERSFMRTGMADMHPKIIEGLKEALAEGLQGTK